MSPCPKWWICIYIQASPINMDATGCEQAKEICCNVNVWSILVNVILQVWHHITSTKYDIISMSTSKWKTSIWFYGKLTDICNGFAFFQFWMIFCRTLRSLSSEWSWSRTTSWSPAWTSSARWRTPWSLPCSSTGWLSSRLRRRHQRKQRRRRRGRPGRELGKENRVGVRCLYFLLSLFHFFS